MSKKTWTDRLGDFVAGKGFYIVLFLCLAAIGISGYYLFSALGPDKEETTVDRVVDAMLERYEAPREVIDEDVRSVVEQLRKIGAIDE